MRLPAPPPRIELSDVVRDSGDLERIVGGRPEVDGRYLHWDELRRRTPPAGMTHELWWLQQRIARETLRRELPLRDVGERPFWVAPTDSVQRNLHLIDRDASGSISLDEPVTSSESRDRYIVSSLIEEAITSSQLEGASTTRQVAKDMLRSGRRPRTRDERMITNNFRAMELIRERTGEPLTPRFVLDLHRVLTLDTLDDDGAAGRLRRTDEPVQVVDDADGHVLHVPPGAADLATRMKAMCRFANGDTPRGYLHPALRAIILHFWLAYDHPFVDGNGRTARALFYWSMVSQGYWLVEYLSISRIIKKAPARYNRAFLYTETDDNDVTYFVIHQLGVLDEAIRELQRYVRRKVEETRTAERMLKRASGLNYRQLALLGHALRHPSTEYTVASHQRSHNVVYETARKDLMDLADRQLLRRSKAGKAYVFLVPANLRERL